MDIHQHNNIERAIDGLCENLVWTWAYYRSLSGLHEVAKASPVLIDTYPQAISCLYHGLFDALFLKLYHFLDSSKSASGFPSLFKLIRRYRQHDKDLLNQIKQDEKRLTKEADLQKIINWRNQVVAHLTSSHLDKLFFMNNRLHISEIERVIIFLEIILDSYSLRILYRSNDMRTPSVAVEQELKSLLNN